MPIIWFAGESAQLRKSGGALLYAMSRDEAGELTPCLYGRIVFGFDKDIFRIFIRPVLCYNGYRKVSMVFCCISEVILFDGR